MTFYRIVGYAREAFETIKDLDYALVDLRKTTTMTEEELNQIYDFLAAYPKAIVKGNKTGLTLTVSYHPEIQPIIIILN